MTEPEFESFQDMMDASIIERKVTDDVEIRETAAIDDYDNRQTAYVVVDRAECEICFTSRWYRTADSHGRERLVAEERTDAYADGYTDAKGN